MVSVQSKLIGLKGERPTRNGIMELFQAMEQRLESKIDRKVEAIEIGFDALAQQITNGANGISRKHEDDYELHLQKIQSRINHISNFVNGGSAKKNDGEDRKRLKEKLKEAMKSENTKSSKIEHEREAWMEYLFGITKPDGRVGKLGSR